MNDISCDAWQEWFQTEQTITYVCSRCDDDDRCVLHVVDHGPHMMIPDGCPFFNCAACWHREDKAGGELK